ncbi:MAG TPA: hypothetical protein VII59_20275 [Streptosporangiaceae bacterium]
MAPKRPAFRTLSAPTAPNADDPAPGVTAPGRPDVKTPAPADKPGRIAFTWRLTPDEANRLDDLVLRMRRDLGLARLDRATVLTALCHLADSNTAVYGAVLGQLQDA